MRKYIWDTNHRDKPFKRKYFIPENRFLEALLTLSKRTDGPLETQCLEWLGRRNNKGYGCVHFRGKDARVHRVAWIVSMGEILDGKEVCHHCDNPACFEVGHLFLGTHGDNMRDAVNKNRIPFRRGSNHHFSKLTDQEVMEIRRLYKAGPYFRGKLTAAQIAERYKVTHNLIYMIVNRSVWNHI